MSSQIYTKTVRLNLATGDNCYKAPAPARGSIIRIVASDVSGTLNTINVYDREDACTGTEISTNPNDDVQLLDPPVHQITPQLTPTNGIVAAFEHDWAYENQDERVSPHNNTPRSAIHFKINVTGASVIDLSYTIEDRSQAS